MLLMHEQKLKYFYETVDRENIYSYEKDHKNHAFYKYLFDFITKWNLEDKSCLEIGSGRGIFQDMVNNYTGVDLADNLSKYYHKKYVAVSSEKLPFPDSSFDAVFSYATHEHIPALEQALNEIIRILKPNGVCLFAPAWHTRSWFANGYALRRYSELNLKEKLIKLTIPIRDFILIRWPLVFLRRVIRLFYYLFVPSPKLYFKKLKANYDKYWQSDSDACNSIDPFDVIMWFRKRNVVCHGYNNVLQTLLVRTHAIELQKKI